MESNNFLIKCIQKINSGSLQIDYTRTSITSNRTVQSLINKRIQQLSSKGFPKIPYWNIEIAGQMALDSIDGVQINGEILKLQLQLDEANKKIKKLEENEWTAHENSRLLYIQNRKLESELEKYTNVLGN